MGGIAAELISLMITGEMPIDLRVTRHCCGKLASHATLSDRAADAAKLAQAIETLDAALIFKAPKGCLSSLRTEALTKLDGITGQAQDINA